MKKLIFTLMMMAGLALVAGTAMGQSSSTSPYVGNEHLYQFPVANADYTFIVTTSDTDASTGVVAEGTTGDGGDNIFEITTGIATGTTTGIGNASINITWLDAAANNTYYVWLSATYNDGTSTNSCPSYRYVTVTPKAFDIIITDITTTYTAAGWKTAAASNASSCPDDAANYNNASFDAGNTTLYFRVTRTNGESTPSPLAIAEEWTFDISIADDNTAAYSGITFSALNGSVSGSNVTITSGSGSETAYELITVTVPNEYINGATETLFTATLSNAKSGGVDESATAAANENDADHILDAIPGIGVFVGN